MPDGPISDDKELLTVLHRACDAVRTALDGTGDWRRRTERPGQYAIDLVADAAALAVLEPAGLGVLSEESGVRGDDRALLAVLDPVDGSTNASRAVPWYATSICVLDGDGPRVAVVANQATGTRYEAVRGSGARLDGVPIRASGCRELSAAVVGLAGWPPRHLGWRQYRALGAAALDMCAVAAGQLDAYVDCTNDAHGPWDFLGGLLVCTEAGAVAGDARGRDLVARSPDARRIPLAAATPELLDVITAARRDFLPKIN